MKLFLLVILVVPGLVLLATPALPLGLLLLWLGWWTFERSGLPTSDAFITVVLVLGGLGAVGPVALELWRRATT